MPLIAIILIALTFMLGACGNQAENSDLAQQYQASLYLDNKQYDQAISLLGNCSQFSGDNKRECLLDLASAYMSKGGYNLIDLGHEFLELEKNKTSDKQFSRDLTSLLFRKINNESVKKGIAVLDELFHHVSADLTNRICTKNSYDKYGKFIIQGCLTSNPLLLKDIINEDDNTGALNQNSSSAVSIKDVITYTSAIQASAPEVTLDDVINIINKTTTNLSNNGTSISPKDKNNNNVNDSLDATSCTIKAYENITFDATRCNINHVTITEKSTDVFTESTNTSLKGVRSVLVTVSNDIASTQSTFYRLAKDVDPTTKTTIYTLNINQNTCDTDGFVTSSSCTINGTTCLPCPAIKEGSQETQSLKDSVDSVFNDPSSFKAIASTLDSGDEDKTEAQKEQDLRNNICGGSSTNVVTIDNLGKCSEKDGEVYIPVDVAIEYFKNSN